LIQLRSSHDSVPVIPTFMIHKGTAIPIEAWTGL